MYLKVFILFVGFSLLNCSRDIASQDMGNIDMGMEISHVHDLQNISDIKYISDMRFGQDVHHDIEDMISDMDTAGIQAIHGARCMANRRIGIVTLERQQKLQINARLYDAPEPEIGMPVLREKGCMFFENKGKCGACADDELCSAESKCVKAPQKLKEIEFSLSNGQQTKSYSLNQYGDIDESVVFPGDAFSIKLNLKGQEILLEKMSLPQKFENATQEMSGTSTTPTGFEFTWDAPEQPHRAFTHIRINHHRPNQGTFTECDIDAKVGKMHIEGEMLRPLAVSTGLEVQTLDHIAFAAAETEIGCVEFRFQFKEFIF